jgi:hypothetical protein
MDLRKERNIQMFIEKNIAMGQKQMRTLARMLFQWSRRKSASAPSRVVAMAQAMDTLNIVDTLKRELG